MLRLVRVERVGVTQVNTPEFPLGNATSRDRHAVVSFLKKADPFCAWPVSMATLGESHSSAWRGR